MSKISTRRTHLYARMDKWPPLGLGVLGFAVDRQLEEKKTSKEDDLIHYLFTLLFICLYDLPSHLPLVNYIYLLEEQTEQIDLKICTGYFNLRLFSVPETVGYYLLSF